MVEIKNGYYEEVVYGDIQPYLGSGYYVNNRKHGLWTFKLKYNNPIMNKVKIITTIINFNNDVPFGESVTYQSDNDCRRYRKYEDGKVVEKKRVYSLKFKIPRYIIEVTKIENGRRKSFIKHSDGVLKERGRYTDSGRPFRTGLWYEKLLPITSKRIPYKYYL